ncbi:MurR/RpiR family transcriptional regulator [Liquorilactobacillus mali]|uniref:Transcriptional regulator n=1 Tax=Liquorilactobacillus mali KCTC 3596 = DSM 20444 TaxID=1046596 RepID=A0A0R2DYV6_9LACO|nr:MurR/RpiR family transcriptional regulator [Liquorilactobacillus mali]KRN09057.1 transcriptional regulator [Liquorilactobacillus mali KCTC 3596 = DSM 20444]QFQ75794.1 MurR/RpiR family transcriptional regulator [Liquorilactobacillus mali]
MIDLKGFTPTEILIYNYLIAHPDEALNLSIRQLGSAIHVSSASIIRCIKKMGYDSFYEFKYNLKQQQMNLQTKKLEADYDTKIINIASTFFRRPLLQQYSHELVSFKKLISNVDSVLFFGIGTSGILAQYGARQFSNFGINSIYNVDPFYPLPQKKQSDANQIAIILSVSGETPEIVDRALSLKADNFHIISITNNNYSTLAKVSEINFSYNIKPEVIKETLNITTQIPVIFILEALARNIEQNY